MVFTKGIRSEIDFYFLARVGLEESFQGRESYAFEAKVFCLPKAAYGITVVKGAQNNSAPPVVLNLNVVRTTGGALLFCAHFTTVMP